jgi:hypothetical protein
MASWAYKRGVSRFELYNEPELDACLKIGTPNAFLEHMYIRARAIRNLFEDLNAGERARQLSSRAGAAAARRGHGAAARARCWAACCHAAAPARGCATCSAASPLTGCWPALLTPCLRASQPPRRRQPRVAPPAGGCLCQDDLLGRRHAVLGRCRGQGSPQPVCKRLCNRPGLQQHGRLQVGRAHLCAAVCRTAPAAPTASSGGVNRRRQLGDARAHRPPHPDAAAGTRTARPARSC